MRRRKCDKAAAREEMREEVERLMSREEEGRAEVAACRRMVEMPT
jgi:hypothetical protein